MPVKVKYARRDGDDQEQTDQRDSFPSEPVQHPTPIIVKYIGHFALGNKPAHL
jgi:hypothetical protein